ncbi:MAG: hypothetical protein ACLP9Y_28425 [Mycobacterium sp.]
MFASQPSHRHLDRLRAQYHYRLQAGYLGLYMLPWNRRRYRLPSALPGVTLLLLRFPLIFGLEIARRVVPGVDRRLAAHEPRSVGTLACVAIRQGGGFRGGDTAARIMTIAGSSLKVGVHFDLRNPGQWRRNPSHVYGSP